MFVGLGLCDGKKRVDFHHGIKMTACDDGVAKRQERRSRPAQCVYKARSVGHDGLPASSRRTVQPEKSSRLVEGPLIDAPVDLAI
jgi:hypothetical protein